MNTDKTYYNLASLTGAEVGEKGNYKVLSLRFSTWDKTEKKQVSKFFTMFLTEDNNDKNRETLQLLGAEVPKIVNSSAVKDLQGLGTRTVDLVATTNEKGYENIKFINEPKFGTRVFDMK